MKSAAVNVGNVNLKGKRHRLLTCKCCEAKDLRSKYQKTLHQKEVKEYEATSDD